MPGDGGIGSGHRDAPQARGEASMSTDHDRRPLDGSIDWDDLHPATKNLLSRRRFLARGGQAVVLFGGLSVFVGACGDDDDDSSTATTTTTAASGDGATESLYTRLGGNEAITAVITDFVDNQVVPDDRINGFFANTDLDRLKTLLVEFTANATGGPEEYTGRDMTASHAGLDITVADFNALVEDLSNSLAVFEVPEQEQGELLGALAPLQDQIVTA
jgi:hemoglobin